MRPMISSGLSQPCRVCGGTEYRHLFPVEAVNILECLDCGFRFPDQLPTTEDLRAHYSEGYGETRFIHGQRVNARINRLVLGRLLGGLENLKILDVGAGYGFLAHDLSKIRNSTCEAVEISRFQRSHARDVLGLKVYGDLSEIHERYDLIVSFEVLEHIADPSLFLSGLSSLLKPAGSLVLATDHFSSPTVTNMRSSFPKWVPHEHISCFTPASVRRLFGQIPSMDLVSLQTYSSWELRLASNLFKIKQRISASREDQSKSRAWLSQLSRKPAGMQGRERRYKFYWPRLLLSPLFASATLSSDTTGEMMIIHAQRKA